MDSEVKPLKEDLHSKTFGVISDTHYCSIYSQPSMVNTFVYECYNRGIDMIYHVGDIVDGDYSRIRPVHNSEVFIWGASGQLNYVVNNLPKYPNIQTRRTRLMHQTSSRIIHSINVWKSSHERQLPLL